MESGIFADDFLSHSAMARLNRRAAPPSEWMSSLVFVVNQEQQDQTHRKESAPEINMEKIGRRDGHRETQ